MRGWLRLAPLAAATLAAATSAQPIALEVREALGENVLTPGFDLLPGRARTAAPVTFGLPLAAQPPVCDPTDLALADRPSQLRVLRRRSDLACGGLGSIEWILVDAQADVAAGGTASLQLVASGAPPPPLAPLATDGATAITVDTGTAVFSVRKQGFDLLDQVVVGSVELVPQGSSPGIELIVGGVTYTSADDLASQVTIEENGPLRAVVVARGRFRSAGGSELLAYTVRLHFCRDRTAVRVFTTLRNASQLDQQHRSFDSLELVLATPLAGGSATLATATGTTATALAPGQVASLFQGENAFPVFRDYDFDDFDPQGDLIRDKWPTLIEGYAVSRDATVLQSGPREQIVDPFFAQLSTPLGAVTIATRFAAGWWPQGLRLGGDGTVRAGLFPVGNDRPFWSRFTSHVTREVLLDFRAGAAPDPEELAFRFQYPLVGKAADVDPYNRSGAFWERLLSTDEQRAWYASQGWPTDYPDLWRPPFHLVRHFYWGTGGGRNQYDQAKVSALDFLREDAPWAGVSWLFAEQKLAYNADLAVYHSDDFDGGDPAIADFNQLPGIDNIPYAKVIFEGEHFHSQGLGLWYLLTGDERFREAYEDLGEYLFHFVVDGYDVEARGVAWHVYNLVDLYRFTGDVRYQQRAWELLRDEVLDKTAVLGASEGTDWQRGFYAAVTDTFDFYNTGSPWPDRDLASFVSGAMHPRSWAYFHDFGAADELQADRARDVLMGVSLFVAGEHWHEYGPAPGDYGFPYRQGADSVPPDPRPDGEWVGGCKEVWPALYWGWVLSGDDELLRRATLLERSFQDTFTDEFQDWPDRQTLEHLLLHPERHERWVDLPLLATDLGDGTWELTWTVPPGAKAYWLKRADRPIVPWLDFDPATRQFAFDPAQFEAFFAADNVVGEPAPGAPGSVQSMAADGVGPGVTHFAGRVLLRAPGEAPLFADGFERGDVSAWD